MNRHDLTRMIQQHNKRLRLLSKKVAAGFAADDVHEMRVAAKRLRALLCLASPDDRRLPRGVRRVYKVAGEIRNLQLLRQRLAAFRTADHLALPVCFFDHVDQRLVLLKQETRLRIETGGGFRKLSRRSNAGLSLRLTRVRQAYFILTRIHRSRHLGAGDIAEQLHALRKSLKDVLYAWPYLDNFARRLAASHFGRHAAMTENASILGDFLDGAFQLRLLDDQALFPGDLDPEMLDELRKRWGVRQDGLLRRLGKLPHIGFEPGIRSAQPISGGRLPASDAYHLAD
jgi:CHAD domain-containing protein